MASNIFNFQPCLGKSSKLTNIFQMGGNHQLGLFFFAFLYLNIKFALTASEFLTIVESIRVSSLFDSLAVQKLSPEVIRVPEKNDDDAGSCCIFFVTFMYISLK